MMTEAFLPVNVLRYESGKNVLTLARYIQLADSGPVLHHFHGEFRGDVRIWPALSPERCCLLGGTNKRTQESQKNITSFWELFLYDPWYLVPAQLR